jgi:hypothetical protein
VAARLNWTEINIDEADWPTFAGFTANDVWDDFGRFLLKLPKRFGPV